MYAIASRSAKDLVLITHNFGLKVPLRICKTLITKTQLSLAM